MNKLSMMNQTYKELKEIARAENVPYSGTNKGTLVARIQHYRDTVGTLYREVKKSLKSMAKAEGIRGYGSLKKSELIDTILFHRRVVKPHIAELSNMTKNDLKRLAKDEGLTVIGGRKDRIAQNIAKHRVFNVRGSTMKNLIEDIANEEFKPKSIEGAFNGNYMRFRSEGIKESEDLVTIEQYLHKVKRHVLNRMKDIVKTGNSWKFQLNINSLFREVNSDDEAIKPIWSTPHIITLGSDFEEVLEEMYQKILNDYEIVSQALNKSNFVFIRIMEMTYHCHKVDMIRGSSYIDLPKWVKSKHCCINPKNEDDDECFKWAVIAALNYGEIDSDHQRISKLKPFVDRYNWSGIKFPTPVKQCKKFENQNLDIALNVLFIDGEKEVNQAYISRYNTTRKKVVDLLLIQKRGKKHYVVIKSLSALLRGITSTHNGDYYCRNCLTSFRTKNALDLHYGACIDHDFCRVDMPRTGENILKYQEGSKSIRVPFVIYADTECILKPILSDDPCCTCNDSSCQEKHGAFTRRVNEHVGCGAAMLVKFAHGEYENAFKQVRGENSIEEFCKTLKSEVNRAMQYKKKVMNELTSKEKSDYKSAIKCYLCNKFFSKNPEKIGERKVRDHCHYTGKFRGAAHSICNLAYQIPSHIPVVFHNLSKYDAHIFIRELANQFDVDEMGVIAENTEKYISFSVPIYVEMKDNYGKPIYYRNKKGVKQKYTEKCMLRFIDSCRFMQSSLASLVDNLAGTNTDGIFCEKCSNSMEFMEIDENFIARFVCNTCSESVKLKQLSLDKLKENFPNLHRYFSSDEIFRQILRKGIYPYEYMDSFERFKETKLPPIEKFYSELNLSGVTNNDYKHAENVFNLMECRDLGDYHDIYLCSDVLLLADVFENFRDVCMEHYKLDPAHFYTAPGLSWQAALKYTGVNLELLTDPDMLLMFEKGIRGGICQATRHYASANNKYMGAEYNEKKSTSYNIYLDANNQYGWAMSLKLPTHGFKWLNEEEFPDADFILAYNEDEGDDGYTLEVDVEYPKKLHKEHNELPFLPEKMKLGKVEKLVCSLYDKEKYVVDVRTLKQCLEHGLVLTKVYRVITYKQSAWLKPYIILNIELRKIARNDFEKNFFKSMINSVFGKTMENKRAHKDIKLACSEKKRKMYASRINYKNTVRFTERLLAMDMRRIKVFIDKPIYTGFTVLDLSKTCMYEFHYDYMKPKYGNCAQLLYMDTDSFIYNVKTDDFYLDISEDVSKRFDTSNYSEDLDRPLKIGMNKKIPGLFKDVLGGEIMTEFVALRAKMYAYKKLDGDVEKRCKGTKKCVVKKRISFEDFKNCYETGVVQYRTQLRFVSHKHVMYTQRVNKVALSANDDKRLQDYDYNRTYAYGTSVGVFCKFELLEKTWDPKRVHKWCF